MSEILFKIPSQFGPKVMSDEDIGKAQANRDAKEDDVIKDGPGWKRKALYQWHRN